MIDFTTTECVLFPELFVKPAVLQFDQRQGSSDGGAILLKAAERRYGLIGGLAVLYGNIAEEGCIVKTAGVDAAHLTFTGPARIRMEARQPHPQSLAGAPGLAALTTSASRGTVRDVSTSRSSAAAARIQFSVGFSTWSMTRVSTVTLARWSLRPSCSSRAVKSSG